MKLNKLFASVFCAMAFCSVYAQDNVLTATAVTDGSDLVLDISLKNSDSYNQINAFSFDFVLSEDMSLEGSVTEAVYTGDRTSITSKRGTTDTWNLSANLAGNVLSVAGTPKAAENFLAGGDGVICTIYLSSTKNYAETEMPLNSVVISNNGAVAPCKYLIGTIGAGGYSTFSATGIDIKIDGATANYASVDASSTSLKLTSYANNVVTANQGAILEGTEGATVYGISVPAAEATKPAANDMVAAPRGAKVSANSVYVLSTEGGNTGFYKYTGTEIPAGKAYLEGSAVASARPMIFIGEATGIDNIGAEASEIEGYDLYGRKANSTKGQMMIENGKKVIRY